MKLQDFGLQDLPYERPNQPWICGWTAAGKDCRIGPDAKGRCRATYECAPIEKNERWQCTRPPRYGGSCEGGPLPSGNCSRPIPKCQPVRSLRAKRGVLVGWASGLTIGLLALALGSSRRGAFLSPGDLAFQHGSTRSAAGPPARRPSNAPAQERCGDCHVARSGPLGLLAVAFGAPRGPAQSDLCLGCHGLGENARQAHSRPPSALAVATARIAGAPQSLASDRGWQCSTCHTEHKGRNFPIAFMESRRCQACHVRTFDSFASGHPEFSGFPYKSGTHIAFDHNKHQTEYFTKASNTKEDRLFECRSCHMLDPSGRNMVVRSFDQTCAACHAEQIADNEGIPFLTVPGFDPKLKGGRVRIGEWPNQSEADLSPFMRLLLEGGEDKAAYLQSLKGVDLLDMGGVSDEELAAVQAYAWGVKRLFADLSRGGHEAFRQRFGNALQGKDTREILTDLVGEIPPATVHAARRAWFPHLLDEMKTVAAGVPLPSPRFLSGAAEPPNVVPQGKEPNKWVEAGGWYRKDLDFTVRYRPTRHGDAFLRVWLDVAAGLRDKNMGARRVLETLNKPTSTGRCLKCHTLGPVSDAAQTVESSRAGAAAPAARPEDSGPAVVHWISNRRDPNERLFTKFGHATHFSLLGEAKGCANCHQLAADAPAEILHSKLMAKAAGDFVPMQKARCMTCHMGKAAGDNCVLCHNYHVGVFATTMTTTTASAAAPASATTSNSR